MEQHGLTVPPLLHYIVLPLFAAGVGHWLSALLGLAAGDTWGAERLAAWGTLYASISAAWLLATRPRGSLGKEGAILLVALAWVLTPFFSALPVAYEMRIPLIDAWFESVSGYTTTGLSVFTGGVDRDYGVYLPSVEELPAAILWWRAVIQWLGGFGVVVFFYTVARLGGLPAHLVGAAEGRFERLEPSIARSLRALMGLYLFLTALSTSLLYLAGMTAPDALYHAMTGLATGGFSTHSSSVGYYDDPVVEAATIIVMLLGGFNFADMYAVLRGLPRRYSGEIPFFLALVSFEVATGTIYLAVTGWAPKHPLREAAFDVVSAATGTGFGISDLSKAPDVYKLFLTAVMLIGGSAFSTTGGIKVFRAALVLKSIAWSISETIYGTKRIRVKRFGSYQVDESLLQSAIAVISLFLLALLAGALTIMLLLPGVSAADALFEAQSALCAVGLSVGITSASTPWSVKLVLMALMTLGRLEVLGFLYAAGALAKMLRDAVAGRRERVYRGRLSFS